MMILKMKKEDLSTFLDSIKQWGELWGPTKKDGRVSFTKVDSLSEMDLKATRTIIPPKKFLYPPRFTMFDYDEDGYVERKGDVPKRILFGIHPCDIHGVLIMDKLFLDKFKDPYYAERREKTILIGGTAVIWLVAMGEGVSYQAQQQIKDLGANNIIVRNTCSGNTTNNWDVVAGNVCLVVQGVTGAAILGNTGGVAPGSTDPNANFSY